MLFVLMKHLDFIGNIKYLYARINFCNQNICHYFDLVRYDFFRFYAEEKEQPRVLMQNGIQFENPLLATLLGRRHPSSVWTVNRTPQ